MREQKLAEKKEQVQKDLEGWAEDHDVLRAGERIVFDIRIEACPTVVQAPSTEDLWGMHPTVFFAEKRLVGFGVPKRRATMIDNAVGWISRESADMTMRDFLRTFPTRKEIQKIRIMGKMCTQHIVDVLHLTNLAHL